MLLQQYERNTYKKNPKQQFHKKFLCDTTFSFTKTHLIEKHNFEDISFIQLQQMYCINDSKMGKVRLGSSLLSFHVNVRAALVQVTKK
jgi:hypothetical protein